MREIVVAALMAITFAPMQGQTKRDFVDLRKIGALAPKGRVQDQEYNPNLPIVEALIKAGPEAIQFLLSKIGDGTPIGEPVIDYWPNPTVGDVAFIVLHDFFLSADWKTSTIPGLEWNDFFDRQPPGCSSYDLMYRFIAKHGRLGLRKKVEIILQPFKGQLFWDSNDRCFKPIKCVNRPNLPLDPDATSAI